VALTDGNGREPDATSGAAPGADREVLAALIEVHRRLDLPDQLEALARLAVAWTGAEAAFAFATDDDRQTLVPVASVRARGSADVTGVRIRAGDLRRWVEEGEPAERTAELLSGSVPPSSILLPIRAAGDEVVALLALLGARGAGDELARVRSLAALARRAFENALQVRAIRDLVIKDDTTECFNRRYFEEFLAEEMSRASRFHAPLSLIFFDMDGLKQVNSLLGHAMGSRALYEVSVRVRGKVRKFDKLFRFGGDEFCIVLPETEWHGALEVAERVRVAIAGKPFLADHLGDRGGVKMTASFGIASFPLHARTKAELLERADWAMQRIKSGVKNSIAIAEIVEEGHGA
jgi:diguanylate cyclase (GGDEF)-like protein